MPELTEELRQITERGAAPGQGGSGMREQFANFFESLLGSTPATQRRALAAQTDAVQTQTDQRRQQMQAHNALAQMMGSQAFADPASMAQLQMSQAQQRQAQTQAQAQAQREQMAETQQRQESLLGMARLMRGTIGGAAERGASPEQIGQIFDRFTPILQQTDPSLDEDALAQFREHVVQNPEVLDSVVQMLGPQNVGGGSSLITDQQGRVFRSFPDGNVQPVVDPESGEQLVEGGFTQAEERLQQGAQRTEIQRQRAQIAQASEARQQRALLEEAGQDQRETLNRLRNIERVSGLVLRDGERLLDLMDESVLFQDRESEMGNIATGVATSVASLLPRAQADAVRRQISTLKSNIAVDQLLNIKREGAGLGQVPQSQLNMLSELLGDIDVNTRPRILRANIMDALEIYSDVAQQAAQEGIDITQSVEQLRRDLDFVPDEAAEQDAPTQTQDADITVDFDDDGNLIIQGMD